MAVALMGLGTMGVGMARNLLKAGFPLTVYNRTAAKAQLFAGSGARIASTPAEAARGAEVVISMLSDDDASRAAWLGVQSGADETEDALGAAEPGAVLVESSTISPAWVAELGALASAKGLSLLDAPVTGSRVQADGAQLIFLVGGEESSLARVAPVLEAMSKQVVYLGPAGSGAKMKLLNNFLCGVQVASLAEGMVWLEQSGLDREKALDVLKKGAPGSPLLAGISARMTSRDYDVNFLLRLMAKDLVYAQAAAAATGVTLSTAANAGTLFAQAIAAGYGEKDMAAVVEPLREADSAAHPGSVNTAPDLR